MTDETGKEVSPTGQAKFTLPGWAIWALTTAMVSAGAIPTLLTVTEQQKNLCYLIAIICAAGLGMTPGLRGKIGMILLCCMPLMGCKTVDPFLVTGRSLDETANQFNLVSQTMMEQVDKGGVTAAEFKAWAVFSDKFTLFYSQAVETWKVARQVGDDVTAGHLGEALQKIGVELFVFYNRLKGAGLLPRGAP